MAELHEALACLRPTEFSNVPTNDLKPFLTEILSKAELIANSVPPPPNGTPYESSKRTRTDSHPAANAADLTISEVRRPPPSPEHEQLRQNWGKPVSLGNKEKATGSSVYKMAGHDRHGAWFARTGVYEGLGFSKWKRAMLREFPVSLEVQGGPGEGNIRGIGGDQRLEDISLEGVGQLQVYQLSAQFPGPASPREFITLLITSDSCLTEASKVGKDIPRHLMVVSIPVSHSEAPPRNGMVRGFYESIEMIREIPLTSDNGDEIAEDSNPVEWIGVTRSDPGGGIPRFMVERSVPSSIVLDCIKFLDWACALPSEEPNTKDDTDNLAVPQEPVRSLSITESNGIMAGVGISIADRPSPSVRRLSHRLETESTEKPKGLLEQAQDMAGAYLPNSLNPLQRTASTSSSSTTSSIGSFASAEQFKTASDGQPADADSSSTPPASIYPEDSAHNRELAKIEDRKKQLQDKLDQARAKQERDLQTDTQKTQKEIEKAAEKHDKEKKRQEERFEKEIRKLEERREKETKKLLARQQKEAEKNGLLKAQRERDEWKQKAELAEQENKLLKEQIGELQKENTALVVRLGKTDVGRDILKAVRGGDDASGRTRASSRGSGRSVESGKKSQLGRSSTSASLA